MDEETLRCYRLLEIQPGASASELKEAYMVLVKVWHPDRFGSDAALQQKAQEKLKEINVAYEKLRSFNPAQSGIDGSKTTSKSRLSMIQVDRFVFHDVFCDETPVRSLLRETDLGRGKMTLSFFNIIAAWAPKFRGVNYFLQDGADTGNFHNCITRTDLANRRITLNRSMPISQKAVILPLAIITIRDNLKGILPCDRTIRRALTCAGWRGGALYESEDYLTAEIVLSNGTAEEFLARSDKKRSGLSAWWTDVKLGYPGIQNLQDASNWLSSQISNYPIGGFFGRK